MASLSSTVSFTASVPPSSYSATPTANASSVSSVTTYVYANGTDSFVPSNASVISNSLPQPTSMFSVSLTTTTASSDASTFSSFATQLSPFPQTSAFSTSTSSTNDPGKSLSAAPASSPTRANGSTSELLSTLLGTSTQSSGSALATRTTASNDLFFNNHNAVIGTFVAVAIFSVAIFVAGLCLVRRWVRRRARDRMPLITTMSEDDSNRGLREGARSSPSVNVINDGAISFTSTCGSDMLPHGVDAGRMITANNLLPSNDATNVGDGGPIGDYFAIDHIPRGLTRSAVTANSRPDSLVPSLAPSTPSIYPPSLPPMEIESNAAISLVYSSSFLPPSINPPPRPPRLKRPPPPPSLVLTKPLAIRRSSATPVPFVTVVPRFSLPIATGHAIHELSKPLELLFPTPPSTLSDHSQTDSPHYSTMNAVSMLDRPANVHLKSKR